MPSISILLCLKEFLFILIFMINDIYFKNNRFENQDGSVGRHTAPPRTTRTDRKSNGKEVQHQVDKKETFIQTGRRGGDGQLGGEDSSCHVAVAGPRLAECGTNGPGSLTTGRPCDPTFAHR